MERETRGGSSITGRVVEQNYLIAIRRGNDERSGILGCDALEYGRRIVERDERRFRLGRSNVAITQRREHCSYAGKLVAGACLR